MTTVEFLPEAREEFFAAALFYDINAPKLGQELVAEVERILAMVVEHINKIGLATSRNCRQVIVRCFPFSVSIKFAAMSFLSWPSLINIAIPITGMHA